MKSKRKERDTNNASEHWRTEKSRKWDLTNLTLLKRVYSLSDICTQKSNLITNNINVVSFRIGVPRGPFFSWMLLLFFHFIPTKVKGDTAVLEFVIIRNYHYLEGKIGKNAKNKKKQSLSRTFRRSRTQNWRTQMRKIVIHDIWWRKGQS